MISIVTISQKKRFPLLTILSKCILKQSKLPDEWVIIEGSKNKEDAEFLDQYIANRQRYGYSDEEKFEMRAAFGDEEVVDIFTGKSIQF